MLVISIPHLYRTTSTIPTCPPPALPQGEPLQGGDYPALCLQSTRTLHLQSFQTSTLKKESQEKKSLPKAITKLIWLEPTSLLPIKSLRSWKLSDLHSRHSLCLQLTYNQHQYKS